MSKTVVTDKKSGHVCPHKLAFILDNRIRRWIQSPKRIVGEYIANGDTVIDLGCGPGFFTIEIAKMVGEKGKVIAVDLQEHMLSSVKKKAARHGVPERVEFHQCESDTIGLNKQADFILAFYMVHETPDPYAFFSETKGMLNPGARLLVVEPKMHVSQPKFETMCKDAERAGLKTIDFPKRKGGRSVLLGI